MAHVMHNVLEPPPSDDLLPIDLADRVVGHQTRFVGSIGSWLLVVHDKGRHTSSGRGETIGLGSPMYEEGEGDEGHRLSVVLLCRRHGSIRTGGNMSILGRVGTTVRDSLTGTLRGTGQVTEVAIDVVRDTTVNALKGARTVGGEAGHLAQDAVIGVLQVTGKIGAEAGSVVRDSAIGVIEGTGQVATATTTMLHDVVVGAIRGSSDAGTELGTAAQGAVEGAL